MDYLKYGCLSTTQRLFCFINQARMNRFLVTIDRFFSQKKALHLKMQRLCYFYLQFPEINFQPSSHRYHLGHRQWL